MTLPEGNLLDLLDWRRRVSELYAEVRDATDSEVAWKHWRTVRDELFRTHSQSPITAEARSAFRGLSYFDHDPAFRTEARIEPADPQEFDVGDSAGGSSRFTRFATARFELAGRQLSLDVFWLDAYGGGVFVPFRDRTAGRETYGAGRYLLDTVKGADLGQAGPGALVFDFNFSYNPSCSYDPRWVCPLAPPGSRLDVEITAGERHSSP